MFDGHAGMDAAVFASKHLHCLLAHKCGLESNPPEALKSAFKLTDEAFIRKAKREVQLQVLGFIRKDLKQVKKDLTSYAHCKISFSI